jgi:spore coat polysaccharide biosynthesis protein SpsF
VRVVAVVQARTQSTRLPGKVLMPLCGVLVVQRVLRRLARSNTLDGIVLATSDLGADDELARVAAKEPAVLVVRGSEQDVLSRYLLAARMARADALVRVTSDCPLIDPAVVDEAVRLLTTNFPDCDYASNTIERTYPRGLDVEVFTTAALEGAGLRARDDYDREHVTPFLWTQPDVFRIRQLRNPVDHSAKRWTLDTPEDLAFLQRTFDALGPAADGASWTTVLRLLEEHPDWEALNADVKQKGRP